MSFQYPDIHMIHELVDQVNAVLDGEIVAVNADGKDSFEVLQQRMNLQNEREIKRTAKLIPVSFVVFDLSGSTAATRRSSRWRSGASSSS